MLPANKVSDITVLMIKERIKLKSSRYFKHKATKISLVMIKIVEHILDMIIVSYTSVKRSLEEDDNKEEEMIL